MPLSPGQKIGPYEILSPLGAGGMGEVYRARDTRLNRIVAIKVLPTHLSGNQDLRERFDREARAVSSLNHPNICTLYDVGHQNGTDYIVMEYLEGETLATRLQNGPLSRSDLLRSSIQIADALDKAHKHGIVHRDLKPGNIILTKGGAKLLDFGLAKLQSELKTVPEVSSLPTEHRELTQPGSVLGTFQYMAPEQLEGKDVDARTDIFAFGAVMYEMATGKKAFEGKSQASLIAAILKEEPQPVSHLQPLTPLLLDRLISTCLAKDPDDRWQSAHDISNQLRWIAESSGSQITRTAVAAPSRSALDSRYAGWIVAALLLIAGVAAAMLLLPRLKTRTQQAIQTHFLINSPENLIGGSNLADPDFAVSPDGTKLVYVLSDITGKKQLHLRPFAEDASQPIPGTDGAQLPFWSPDGQQIAFVSESRIKRIPIGGGNAQMICDVKAEMRGGVWLNDGTILFSVIGSPLYRVSAEGGEPKPFTELDVAANERGHYWPVALPDSNHFLFLADKKDPAARAVYLASLDSKERTELLKTPFTARYIDPGYLLYLEANTLMAKRLELDPPRLTGDAVRVADRLFGNMIRGVSPYNSSARGVIAYCSFGSIYKTQLTWFSRTGKQLQTVGPVSSDVSVNLSPDEKRAAIASVSEIGRSAGRAEIPVNIWVVDLARGVRTRLTFDPSTSDENPTWSPDGRTLVFASHAKSANANIYQKSATGDGPAQPVLTGTGNEHPIDWSPDGKFLLLHTDQGFESTLDMLLLPLTGDRKIRPFHATEFREGQGRISPDGKWVAYTSGESGRLEVYVKSFTGGAGKWQVSSAGGAEPRWRKDGKELFYVALDGMIMAVELRAGGSIDVLQPTPLFDTHLPPSDLNHYGGTARYDVSHDGMRFLINSVVVPATPPTLNVITNWNPPRP